MKSLFERNKKGQYTVTALGALAIVLVTASIIIAVGKSNSPSEEQSSNAQTRISVKTHNMGKTEALHNALTTDKGFSFENDIQSGLII